MMTVIPEKFTNLVIARTETCLFPAIAAEPAPHPPPHELISPIIMQTALLDSTLCMNFRSGSTY